MNTPKACPDAVAEELQKWVLPHTDILQMWESEGTYYFVTRHESMVRCVRIFEIAGNWMASVDFSD